MSCTPSETTHEDAFRRIPTHFARAAALRRTGITSVHLHDNLARLQHITGNRPLVLNELGNGQLALRSKPTCNSAARGEPVRAAPLMRAGSIETTPKSEEARESEEPSGSALSKIAPALTLHGYALPSRRDLREPKTSIGLTHAVRGLGIRAAPSFAELCTASSGRAQPRGARA